jgi:hypothetical protein
MTNDSLPANMAWFLFLAASLPAQPPPDIAIPEVKPIFGEIPRRFEKYDVVLEPDKNEPEWQAGAPSVVRDKKGVFWLAARMRTADSPRGNRGYEIRILRSEDGIHFTKAHSIRREDVPIANFERPSLIIDPRTGRFKLYNFGSLKGGPNSIIKFDDADDPARFMASTAHAVISPKLQQDELVRVVTGYKDPVILHAEGAFHCYVIGRLAGLERAFHFTSPDGETWQAVGHRGDSLLDLAGWHNFAVRPASVLPLGVGYLFVYEGSDAKWYDSGFSIATGLGFTFDLHRIIDLTPESPLLISTTPSGRSLFAWRYSHWMHVGDEIWVYAEVARPNRSNEIRLFRLRR